MDLTGAQIKTVLEQQWQRDDEGAVPSRPFLRLGTSKGFEYSYDPARPEGSRITGIWLNGKALSRTTAYSVTVNSFLAAGGDNFREFAKGTNKRDTGQVDLETMVDYLKEFAGDKPLPLDATQRSVGATVTPTTIKLSSLAMTGSGDPVDTEVRGLRRCAVARHLAGDLDAGRDPVRRGRHGKRAEHGPERRAAAPAACRRRHHGHRHPGAGAHGEGRGEGIGEGQAEEGRGRPDSRQGRRRGQVRNQACRWAGPGEGGRQDLQGEAQERPRRGHAAEVHEDRQEGRCGEVPGNATTAADSARTTFRVVNP